MSTPSWPTIEEFDALWAASRRPDPIELAPLFMHPSQFAIIKAACGASPTASARIEFAACEYDVLDVEVRVSVGERHRVVGGARRKRARVRRVA